MCSELANNQYFNWCACACTLAQSLSHVRLSSTPWTVAHQAPLSMGFSRQGYWSVLPFPSPGALPDPRVEPLSLCLLHCKCVLYQ